MATKCNFILGNRRQRKLSFPQGTSLAFIPWDSSIIIIVHISEAIFVLRLGYSPYNVQCSRENGISSKKLTMLLLAIWSIEKANIWSHKIFSYMTKSFYERWPLKFLQGGMDGFCRDKVAAGFQTFVFEIICRTQHPWKLFHANCRQQSLADSQVRANLLSPQQHLSEQEILLEK